MALTLAIFLAQQYFALNPLEQSGGAFLEVSLVPSEYVTKRYTIFDAVYPRLHTILPGCAVAKLDRRDIICGQDKRTRLVRIPKTRQR